MAPLVLEGDTLGKRHQYYNQLLRDATANSTIKPAKVDYSKTDIENLFNIDIASTNRDVEYILEALKGEDMLYISRVIKRSKWLFTEAQYAHIIDPEYLHSQLFPYMMPKATRKLLFHIRLALKDESRVEKFFQYFNEKDLKIAVKWLPNCPISVIEDFVQKHALEISPDIFKRLCRRSAIVLELFVKARETLHDHHYSYFRVASFLLRSDPKLYLDSLEKCEKISISFNKKHTEILMKTCSERIIKNFEKYKCRIDLNAFAKFLTKENIKRIVFEQLENKDRRETFGRDIICKLIKHLPKEEQFKFVKILIDKVTKTGASYANMYRWYQFAPFDVAFPKLKKMIHKESKPNVRTFMLKTLVISAGKNLAHIHTLLKYYREHHINQEFWYKSLFLHDLCEKTYPNLYDSKSWAILDEIFRSMEIYSTESKNHVQQYIKVIIAYKITHDEPVPNIIEQKVQIDYMNSYGCKLKGSEREKFFNYVFNLFLFKLNSCVISNEREFKEYIQLLRQGFTLLNDWNKELLDYPILINKVKDCIQIRKEKGWSTSLVVLYYIKKSWRKHILEESLTLRPSQEIYMKVLKHDPELLARHQDEVDLFCCNDAVRMDKLLTKLRVYWPQTLANEWTVRYREHLDKTGGHKAIVRGLCCLLNKPQLLEFLKEYAPQETKTNQDDPDELQLNIHKNIAQSMHVARPQVTPNVVLGYAKSGYMKYIHLPLHSVLLNLRPNDSQYYIQILLNGTTSLQKLSLHLAFAQLSTVDMIKMLRDLWKTTENPSVRAALFRNARKLLFKETNETSIRESWELMESFIDSLTAKEDKSIYYNFGKLYFVHPCVKPICYMKSYRFLKSLPRRGVWKKILRQLKVQMSMFSEQLDSDFVEEIIEDFVNEVIVKRNYEQCSHSYDMKILTTYLLSADDEDIQTERYEKVFVPLIDKSLLVWDNDDSDCVVRQNFDEIIKHLFRLTDDSVRNNKTKPSSLYRKILKKLERTLPSMEYIILFRLLKVAAAIVDILYKNKSTRSKNSVYGWQIMDDIYLASVPDIGKVIIRCIKEDLDSYGLLYHPTSEALEYVFTHFGISKSIMLKCFKYMLMRKSNIPVCLFVMEALPDNILDIQREDHDSMDMENEITRDAIEIRDILLSYPSPLVQIQYVMKLSGDDDTDDEYDEEYEEEYFN